MDFFGHQDAARKKTSTLVVFFILAVILIILSVYLVCALVILLLNEKSGAHIALWQPRLFLWVMGGTTIVVVLGTLWKIHELRGGGATIATMLGGRPIPPNTTDPNERKALNIVEEMSIASGIRVPPVYLLSNEPRINAFAAGFTPADAVIGVTRGAIQQLSRDELQGVIGHEFSHILNGDMLLNIRLMGFLHGILLIALVGYAVMRGASRVRGKNAGGAILLGLVIGLSLMAIGWIGVFFGRLIKSAVSRQREFLADASAVQFTRNPSGIAGALKKIGGTTGGARLEASQAEEASHLFFGNGVKSSFLGLLSTHPPLEERIRRLDPQFDGKFPAVALEAAPEAADPMAAVLEHFQAAGLDASSTSTISLEPESAVARVGTLQPEQIAYAAQLVASIPRPVRDAIHEPVGAQAVVFGLLMDSDAEIRRRQWDQLTATAEPAVLQEARRLEGPTCELGPEARLPIIDMAMPALQQLSAEQYQKFRANICALVEADRQIRLFEFAFNRILLRHLDPIFSGTRRKIVQYYSLDPLRPDCALLLSALAHVGEAGADHAMRAFASASSRLDLDPQMVPLEQCGIQAVDESLDRLSALSAPLKKQVLEACAACVGFDGQVTLEEAELFRAVADALDCPMPPFVDRGS